MLKMKQREFTPENRCKIQRERNLILEGGKKLEMRYKEAVFVKQTIKDVLTGNRILNESEIRKEADAVYHESGYLSPETERIKADEAVRQIMRYCTSEDRIPEKHPGRKIINLFEKIEVETLPDFIFRGKRTIKKKMVDGGKKNSYYEEEMEYLEVVKICCRKPNITATGSKKDTSAPHNLELYSMLQYAKSLIPETRKEKILLGASFYFTLTKNDKSSTGEWEEDFFHGKGAGNIVTLWDEYFPGLPSEMDVQFAFEVDDWIKGEEKRSDEWCSRCKYNATCNYTLPPQKMGEETSRRITEINLTNEQEAAIGFRRGICDINAGAGAGKTLVVALRVAFMIMEGCDPKDILCITFTKDGAREMKERIKLYLENMGWSGSLDGLNITTFNAFGDGIIRKEYKQLGFEKEPGIVEDVDRLAMIADLLNEQPVCGLDYRNFTMNETNCRGAVAMAADFCNVVKTNAINVINDQKIALIREKMETSLSEDTIKDLFDLYIRFNNRLKKENLLEYADQELMLLDLLSQNPYYFEDNENTFKHIIVDEFQDTNPTQFKILQYLIDTPAKESFMVVGDDSQNIYGFRGATSDLLVHFEEHIGDKVTHFYLLDNHRSTPQIIEFANALNRKNAHRVEKDLKATRPDGEPVEIMSFWKDEELLQETVNIIKTELEKGRKYEDIACLDSTRTELMKLGTILTENGIPWIMLSPEPELENSRVKAAIAFNNAVADSTATKDIFEYLNAVCRNEILKNTDAEIEERITEFIKTVQEKKDAGEKELTDWFLEKLKELDDEDEIYEGFLEKISLRTSYKSISEYISNFSVFGQKQTQKRKLRYPGVVLTTAHSSKGLEWPVIINNITKYHKKALNDEKTEAQRRLFFVSATRARDKLYVLGKKVAYGNKANNTRYFNQFLREAYEILGETMDVTEPKK